MRNKHDKKSRFSTIIVNTSAIARTSQRVHIGDARAHLAQSQRLYDVIFLDAYDGLEIPYRLRSRQFYELVRFRLRPGGAVATNLDPRSELYASDRNTLGSVFETAMPSRQWLRWR
jgi:spermidine synthase